MTGQQILKVATDLLGYTNANGNLQLSSRIMGKALVNLNLIYSDLWRACSDEEFIPLSNIHGEVKLPERIINDIMPYGVAMMLAQSESDGDQQQLYSVLYNRKRASLVKKESIKDVLPRCYDL
jgi:hypothetical protein